MVGWGWGCAEGGGGGGGGDSGGHTFYRGADAASPASPMQVLHGVLRGPQVVDMAHSRQV